ncbi:MAG: MFS transporter, partial [Alistipes sp.]|nr:MFS transporter [Alistipes sp.]
MSTQKKNFILPIIVMFALFFMIAFVTNFAGSMGVIVQNQFGATPAMAQLGTLANFIAYACMGIPAGIILRRKGYKFTSLLAVTVGFIGVGLQFLSGYAESFPVYVTGAFVAGFSMCLLNIVVNPMLNTLGGGGNKGNQLIQLGGSLNSVGGTLAPILLGYLIGGNVEAASVSDAAPAMIIAMAIFALAFVIIVLTKIPEPHMETAEEKAARKAGNQVKDKYSPLSFRHFVLGAVAIFFYVGIEVGIPNIANLYMTTPTMEQAEKTIADYEAQTAAEVVAEAVETETVAEAVETESVAEATKLSEAEA